MKCRRGYKPKNGKCVRSKDTFFRPRSSLNKGLLWASLLLIVISGIIGASFLLFGSFSDTTLKILSTTGITGVGTMLILGFTRFKDKVFSWTTISTAIISMLLLLLNIWEITDMDFWKVWLTIGLFAVAETLALLSYADKNKFLKYAGPLAVIVASVMWLGGIWEWFTITDTMVRWALSFSVVGFTLAHISLINNAKGSRDKLVKGFFWTVVGLIVIVTAMLVYLIFNVQNVDFSNMFFRILGFFAILDIAGSIALPILKKVRG